MPLSSVWHRISLKKGAVGHNSDCSLSSTNQSNTYQEGEGSRDPDRWPSLEARHPEYWIEEYGKTHSQLVEALYCGRQMRQMFLRLADQDEEILGKQWNSFHLKWYYVWTFDLFNEKNYYYAPFLYILSFANLYWSLTTDSQSSPWRLKLIHRLSWKMKIVLTAHFDSL